MSGWKKVCMKNAWYLKVVRYLTNRYCQVKFTCQVKSHLQVNTAAQYYYCASSKTKNEIVDVLFQWKGMLGRGYFLLNTSYSDFLVVFSL